MPLFISNSNKVRLRFSWTALLLGMIVGFCLLVELATRVGFDTMSEIQRRVVREYAAASLSGINTRKGVRSILVVGNSLLNEGLEFNTFQSGMRPAFDSCRLVVENTSYFDWYYGLKRLFSRGARPDFVLLMLTPNQIVATRIRGGYSAQYLFDARDIFAIAENVGMHPTEGTSLFFARVSKFYGVKAEIRNWFLEKTVQDINSLGGVFADRRPDKTDSRQIVASAKTRLGALRQLADGYRCRLFIVVPPVQDKQDGEQELQKAGSASGVPILIAVSSGTLGSAYFADGFHLNSNGAKVFTAHLLPLLRRELSDGPRAAFE
jgi:hypothetical protein